MVGSQDARISAFHTVRLSWMSRTGAERVELAEIQREDAGIRFNLSMEITCSDAAEATCLVPEQGVAAVKTQSGGVHKCKVGGAVRFQDRPCAPGTEAR